MCQDGHVRIALFALAACSVAGCQFLVPSAIDGDLETAGEADLAEPPPDDLDAPGGDLAGALDLAMAPDLLVTGILTGSRVDMPGKVDLAAEGTSDWTHYGLNVVTDVDRKSGVAASIAMTSVGVVRQFSFYAPTMVWTGGTPTASASTTSGVFTTGAGSSFTLTIPADAKTRTVRLYLTQYQSTCALKAHLSDGSAADFAMSTSIGGTNVYHQYTLNFRASHPGQTLTVSWTMTTDAGSGTIDLLAATYF